MSKRDDFEQVDDDQDEQEEENVVPPAPAKRPEPLVSARRNLTHERIRASLEGDKASALKLIGEEETVTVALPKLDPKTGEKVRDSLGYLVTESRTVLKKDFVSKHWDEKIAKMCGKLERHD